MRQTVNLLTPVFIGSSPVATTYIDVVQLVSILDLGSRDREFESHRLYGLVALIG